MRDDFELLSATSNFIFWNRLHCPGTERLERGGWGAYGNGSTWVGLEA